MTRPFKLRWALPLAVLLAVWAPLLLLLEVDAAVETTTVQGKILYPDGNPVTSGEVLLQLSDAGTTDDAGTEQVVGGRVSPSIGSDGSVSFSVVPNDAISPSGTYYRVTVKATRPVRASWVMKWQIDTSPDPVDIGDITRLDVAPGISVGNFVKRAAVEPSGACTAQDVATIADDTGRLCNCRSLTWICGQQHEQQAFGDPGGEPIFAGMFLSDPVGTPAEASFVIDCDNGAGCPGGVSSNMALKGNPSLFSGDVSFRMFEGTNGAGLKLEFRPPTGISYGSLNIVPGSDLFWLNNNSLKTFRMDANTTTLGETAFAFNNFIFPAHQMVHNGTSPLGSGKFRHDYFGEAIMDFDGFNAVFQSTVPAATIAWNNYYAAYEYGYSYDYSWAEAVDVIRITGEDDWDETASTAKTTETTFSWKPQGGIQQRDQSGEAVPACNGTTMNGHHYFRAGQYWFCDGTQNNPVLFTAGGQAQAIDAFWSIDAPLFIETNSTDDGIDEVNFRRSGEQGPRYPLILENDAPSPAIGDGVGIGFEIEKLDNATRFAAGNITAVATKMTAGSEDSRLEFYNSRNGVPKLHAILNEFGDLRLPLGAFVNDNEGSFISSTADSSTADGVNLRWIPGYPVILGVDIPTSGAQSFVAQHLQTDLVTMEDDVFVQHYDDDGSKRWVVEAKNGATAELIAEEESGDLDHFGGYLRYSGATNIISIGSRASGFTADAIQFDRLSQDVEILGNLTQTANDHTITNAENSLGIKLKGSTASGASPTLAFETDNAAETMTLRADSAGDLLISDDAAATLVKVTQAGDVDLATAGATVDGVDLDDAVVNTDTVLTAADLAVGSCTANQVRIDTGGATAELCVCFTTNVWSCWDVPDTANGPKD